MDQTAIGVVGLVAMVALMVLRAPIGLAMGSVAIVGTIFIVGPRGAFSLARNMPYETATMFEFSAIPMYLLLGALCHHSQMTTSLYQAARLWLGFLPGGLAVATTFTCAGFAATTGSSLATTLAVGRIAYPEMRRYGYDPGLSAAVCACSGTLGILIPPSILMVVYGIFAEVSVARLFMAGVIPGLLTAAMFMGVIVVRCKVTPKLAPALEERITWAEKFASLRGVWPLPLLIVGVLGSIYGGFVTPTEAGGVGVVLAFIIAVAQRTMSWQVLKVSVMDAVQTTVIIFFIVIGAFFLAKFMALNGLPELLAKSMGGGAVDRLLLVSGIVIVFIIGGMFMDGMGLMLLTLPIFLPLFESAGFDLVWLGILVVKLVEIGLMTPPVGLNVFAMKSVVGDQVPLMAIFKGITIFLAADLVIVLLLVAFPALALFLPNTMF
ncbi:MAG: TRAP transporter large permease [Betaproteobacteria bacterium]